MASRKWASLWRSWSGGDVGGTVGTPANYGGNNNLSRRRPSAKWLACEPALENAAEAGMSGRRRSGEMKAVDCESWYQRSARIKGDDLPASKTEKRAWRKEEDEKAKTMAESLGRSGVYGGWKPSPALHALGKNGTFAFRSGYYLPHFRFLHIALLTANARWLTPSAGWCHHAWRTWRTGMQLQTFNAC